MLRGLLGFLLGSRGVSVSAADGAAAMEVLRRCGFPQWGMRRGSDGRIAFLLGRKNAVRYAEDCAAAGVEVRLERERGLPAWLMRYRRRWGLLFGAVLFALIVWQSGRIVWSVDVSGNVRYSDDAITEMLREYGFGVGSVFTHTDFDRLQNAFLLQAKDIAWIAVNMQGTVAHVEVLEKRPGGEGQSGESAANVIAAEDGQIVEVRVRGGRADVSVNDVVRRGDLLISGVIRVGEDGVRYEYAAGQVLAQVMREIDVRVPLVQERKVYTEEELCEKTVIFFGKQVKLFTKSGIVGSSYGKIEGRTYDSSVQTRQWVLPGGISLPVWIRTETFRPYVWETAEQSEEQAYAQALRLYREKMEQLLSEAEILSLETSVEREDGEVRIFSRAVCLSDIARTSEISLTESAAP